MIDAIFTALANERRRVVIRHVATAGESTVSEAAEHVAAYEYDDPTDRNIKTAYVSLYQTHLPKLSEIGLIEYDTDTGEIRRSMLTGRASVFIGEAKEKFT